MNSTTPVRQAALLLHAMQDADQTWLLSELPDEARACLQALLVELRELGIPPDSTLLQEALTANTAGTARTPQEPHIGSEPESHSLNLNNVDGMMHFLSNLSGQKVSQLAQLLYAEPAGLIAHLLQLHDWTWSEALLRQLNTIQRSDVEAALQTPAPAAHALKAVLISAVCRSLKTESPVENPVALARIPAPVVNAANAGKKSPVSWVYQLIKGQRNVGGV